MDATSRCRAARDNEVSASPLGRGVRSGKPPVRLGPYSFGGCGIGFTPTPFVISSEVEKSLNISVESANRKPLMMHEKSIE
jgi:hypothetical protein